MTNKAAHFLQNLLKIIFSEDGSGMTFKVKNSLITMGLFLLLIMVLIGLTYNSTRGIMDRTVQNSQLNITAQAAAATNMWADQQMKILSSAMSAIGKNPEDDIDGTLETLRMTMEAGDFSDVYIGLENGMMIDGANWVPPSGYDPRIRPWYNRAAVSQKMGFTIPYVDMTTNQLVIALSAPITLHGSMKGVISADIILDKLMQNVVNVKSVQDDRTFIVGPAGTIMVHPDKELLMKVKLQDIDPSLKNIITLMEKNSAGTFEYTANGEKQILAFQKIEGVQWYLCTSMSKKDAYELSGRTSVLFATEFVLKFLGILVVLTILGVGGSVIILYFYNRRFTSTVHKQQVQILGMNENLQWNMTKMKDLEAHYQTLFNVANDAVMVCKGMVFVDCNDKAKEIFGVGQYGIIGNNILEFSPTYQPDGVRSHEKALNIIEEADKGEQQFFNWNFKRFDMTEFPAEVGLKKLKLNNEHLILLSIRDISKRVNVEQQLKQAVKMATMGEMVGAIAHQWRQPLNILSTYISSLQSAFYNNMVNKDFVERLVNGSDTQIQFMSKTIDDFRHFFKPAKDKEFFDVRDAVETGVRLVSAQYKQSDIILEVRLPEKRFPLTIYGSRSEFIHVIVNLLANARDAVLERKSTDNDAKNLKVIIDVEETDKNVIINVTDYGCRIAPHIMSRIFNPYFTTKSANSGTGIGLYMSKMIVETEMNGTLAADNHDEGAVFTITLVKSSKEEDIV